MKKITQYITTTMMLCCGAAIATPMDHITTQSVTQELKQYLSNANDGWFVYSIKAAPETRSMCCFNDREHAACDLNNKQYGYGSSSDSPYTESIHIFTQVKQGSIKRIMPVGDSCEVKGKGQTVDWLQNVTAQQSISWLKDQAMAQDDHNGSLYVLSLHPEKQASEAIYSLAKDNHKDYSEQAVFWLGQRKDDGFAYLKKLYKELPKGDVRHHLNFALSQHESTEAINLLKKIATNDQDSEQQADAIFWLSQTDSIDNLPQFLMNLMNESQYREVKEKAIFSLSQINTAEASEHLAQLVKSHQDPEVREQSLFWLAQNDPEKAQKAAIKLLKSPSNESEQENAVFVLSQLPNQQSADALFAILKGNYHKNIKKKALFWLSQSDDKTTLDRLEKML
jgi:HEAT repeat protein